jgi:hypothetical protein
VNDNKMPTGPVPAGWQNLDEAEAKLKELFRGMVDHNGVSKLQIEVKPLKKGKKDVVFSSGKDYHFVLKPAQTPVADDPPGHPAGGNPGD